MQNYQKKSIQELSDETQDYLEKYIELATPPDFHGIIMRLFDFDLNNVEDYANACGGWLKYLAENCEKAKELEKEILNPDFELLLVMLDNMIRFCNEVIRSKHIMAGLQLANLTMNLDCNEDSRPALTCIHIEYKNKVKEAEELNSFLKE